MDGRLVESLHDALAGWITALIINKLTPFVLAQDLGILLPPDTQF
ncbi:MAG TPA: hypothetical protein VL096_19150 [Pirellulaceae bacterium]|nr:hypothetical protein [Pirellulaceae bacterium]